MTIKSQKPSAAAFTLTEIMIAVTLFGILSVGVFSAFIQCMRGYTYDAFRLEINHDMRNVTDELTSNATFANSFFILKDFTTRTVGPDAAGVTRFATINDGSSGDCIVFAFTDPATSNSSDISKLVGYYVSTVGTNDRRMYKFTVNLSPSVTLAYKTNDPGYIAGTSTLIYSLLPAASTEFTNTQLIPDTKPQNITAGSTATLKTVTTPAGTVLSTFFNFKGKTAIVNAQVQYSSNSKAIKTTLSTYSFCISPRG